MFKIGLKCGKGWISRDKQCLKELSPDAAGKTTSVVKLIETVDSLNSTNDKKIYQTSTTEEALLYAGNGLKTDRELKVDEKELKSRADIAQRETAKKIKSEGLQKITDSEALALSIFLKNSDSASRLLEESQGKLYDDILILSNKALSKLPKFSADRAEDAFVKRGENPEEVMEQTGILRHNLKVSENALEDFLRPYEEALLADTEYTEPRILSAKATKAMEAPKAKENVQIEIQAKHGAEGNGVYVEEFKEREKNKHEAEVLFPSGTKFEVLEVKRKPKKPNLVLSDIITDNYTLDELDRLPEKIYPVDANLEISYEDSLVFRQVIVYLNAINTAKSQEQAAYYREALKKVAGDLEPGEIPARSIISKVAKQVVAYNKKIQSIPNFTKIVLAETQKF